MARLSSADARSLATGNYRALLSACSLRPRHLVLGPPLNPIFTTCCATAFFPQDRQRLPGFAMDITATAPVAGPSFLRLLIQSRSAALTFEQHQFDRPLAPLQAQLPPTTGRLPT